MCQTDFTGLGETSSTGHRYRRNGVVRGAERAFRDESTVFAQLSGNRMNLGRFQTLSQREGRKYRWQTLGKHGLTAARRTEEVYCGCPKQLPPRLVSHFPVLLLLQSRNRSCSAGNRIPRGC